MTSTMCASCLSDDDSVPAGTDKMEQGRMLSYEQRTADEIVDFIDEFATSLNKDEL